jgi:hypothetical protein
MEESKSVHLLDRCRAEYLRPYRRRGVIYTLAPDLRRSDAVRRSSRSV